MYDYLQVYFCHFSGPIKFCINLPGKNFEKLEPSDSMSLATYLLPKYMVADAAEIKLDGVNFDVWGKIQDLTETKLRVRSPPPRMPPPPPMPPPPRPVEADSFPTAHVF